MTTPLPYLSNSSNRTGNLTRILLSTTFPMHARRASDSSKPCVHSPSLKTIDLSTALDAITEARDERQRGDVQRLGLKQHKQYSPQDVLKVVESEKQRTALASGLADIGQSGDGVGRKRKHTMTEGANEVGDCSALVVRGRC